MAQQRQNQKVQSQELQTLEDTIAMALPTAKPSSKFFYTQQDIFSFPPWT